MNSNESFFFQCFSSKLKTALEEIVSGQNNDAKCKEFQEEHEKYYGVAPPKCKFKENPEEIPKLIEKIVIGKDGNFQIEKPKQSFKARFKNFFKRQ